MLMVYNMSVFSSELSKNISTNNTETLFFYYAMTRCMLTATQKTDSLTWNASFVQLIIRPFEGNVLFLYHLKMSENFVGLSMNGAHTPVFI